MPLEENILMSNGKQANQFAYFVKWGMSPAQALQLGGAGARRVHPISRHSGLCARAVKLSWISATLYK